MTNTDQVIESLVQLMCGASERRTQQLFRQNLQVLVELARNEERQEMLQEFPAGHRRSTNTVH